MIINPILKTDSYKESHWKQYPKDTKYVHSYLESRGGLFPKTVFFGMQYIIQVTAKAGKQSCWLDWAAPLPAEWENSPGPNRI